MNEDVRKVTELEIRRLLLGIERTELCVQIELCCDEGGGLNRRTMRRWEERAHRPQGLFRRALCKFFKVDSVAQLGLGDTFEAARWWTWMTPDEWIKEVNRRKVVEALTKTGLLLPVPKLTAAAQLLEGRRSLGMGDVALATDIATGIAAAYLKAPDTDAVRAAKAQVYTLVDRFKHAAMSGATRTRLTAVASDAACVAGSGYLNAGHLDEADRWFEDALDLARQAGDRRLEALALASCAWVPLHKPDPDRAAALAALEAAAGFQRFLRPAARAWVFASLSEQHAVLGDDQVSGRFLEHALAAAALIRYEGPGWGLWSVQGALDGWEGVRAQVFTGIRSLGLGRPAEALELFEGALEGTTQPVRRSSLHEHLMQACVGLEDPDRACASAHTALDEAEEYGLGLWPEKIRKVRATFPEPWAKLRPVIELDERLALAG